MVFHYPDYEAPIYLDNVEVTPRVPATEIDPAQPPEVEWSAIRLGNEPFDCTDLLHDRVLQWLHAAVLRDTGLE
jgi:hypothetical protein